MIRLRLTLALMLACVAPLASAWLGAAHAQVADAAPQSRQILVMLRLMPDHFRPGSSYGSGSYGDRQTMNARRRIAERIARRNGMVLAENGWPMPLVGLDCYVMIVPPGRSVDNAIAQISRDPNVVWSQPIAVYRALESERRDMDPLFTAQPAAQTWRLADLHRIVTGRGATIAVIDSRVDIAHADLAGQFIANEDFVGGPAGAPERHGTAVAGVIAAKADNGMGIAGIAPGARLMALRACWQSGGGAPAAPTLCDSLSLARAVQFAIEHNANVINLSLSGPPDQLLERLLGVAMARHIAVVAAFDPDLPKGGFPASIPGVIAVANESLATYPSSVYGAPGRDVPTTQPGGKWYLVTGSSYAAAHVSGLIALVRQEHASPRKGLVASRPRGGVIDACASVFEVTARCDCSCALAGAQRR